MLTATLIGDVVASRRADDRSALHGRLTTLLEAINAECAPTTPLRITVGDEFQGAFATVGQALQASLRLRIGLLPRHDVRHGLGWGEVTVLQEQPRVEDGPGWWAARDAIHEVPVVDGDGRVTGMVSANDALRFVARALGYVLP